jgi:hypothetical protein
MVAWLPRENTGGVNANGATLQVFSAADCLLIAVNSKEDRIWRYNGDHLKRWCAEHVRQLQRWSEDAKYENRPVPSFASRRDASVRKFRARLDSATHEIAAQLAGYAERRRYAAVSYDDRERTYCEQFPYSELRRKLAEKLDQRGICLELLSSEKVTEETAAVTADSTD